MRMYSLFLVLVVAACVTASGVKLAESQEASAAVPVVSAIPVVGQQAAPAVSVSVSVAVAADSGVHKLGAVELPYTGDGLIEYDREHRLWNIAFAAPEGWQCTHVGWSFSAGDDVSDLLGEFSETLREGEVDGENGVVMQLGVAYWSVSGILEADVTDGILYLSVSTSDKTYAFEFVYDPEMADPDLTLVQSEDTGVLKDVTDNGNVALNNQLGVPSVVGNSHATAPTCPGGSCECTGKCKACCSAGFHPSCNRCGLNNARCICYKNVKVPIGLELRDIIRVSE